MMADQKMIFFHFFSKQFLGLPKWQSDKQQIVFRKLFRDFCPVIWAFCQIFSRECSGTSVPLSGHFAFFFPGHISGTSVPLSGHSAFFFLREPFRDFCPVISAFCRFFFRKHFRDFCPVIWAFCGFFSGNISGTSVPLSGHSAIFFSRLAKTAEQLSNFWKLLKIENWFKFSIVQKVLCCSFHFVPIRFKNWFWFPRNVPGTSVSFSDRILPNMAPKKKKYSKKCSGGSVSCHGKMHGFHWKMHGFHWNMHGFHWNMHGFHGKMHGFHGKMHGFHGKMHGFHVKMHGLHGKIHGFHNMSNFWVTIFVFPLSKWASSLWTISWRKKRGHL